MKSIVDEMHRALLMSTVGIIHMPARKGSDDYEVIAAAAMNGVKIFTKSFHSGSMSSFKLSEIDYWPRHLLGRLQGGSWVVVKPRPALELLADQAR